MCKSPLLCPLRLLLSFTCEEWGGGPIRLPSACSVGETSWLAGVVGVRLGVLGGGNRALSEKQMQTGFSTSIPSFFQKLRLFWGGLWVALSLAYRCVSSVYPAAESSAARCLSLACYFPPAASSDLWLKTAALKQTQVQTVLQPLEFSSYTSNIVNEPTEVDYWLMHGTHRLCLSPTGRESGNTRGSARRALGPASSEWMPGWKMGRQWDRQ